MRISTNTLFDSGATRISNLQGNLSKAQEQISAGKRVLTPSDDPTAAARAVVLTQSQATNTQYGINRRTASDALNTEEQVLQGVTNLLQDLKTSIIKAGNGSLDDVQRSFIGTEIAGRFNDLLALANSVDGTGAHIFSGYQTATVPFTKTSTGASFNGDEGERISQVGPQRQFAVNDSGAAVFERIRSGNGVFATSASNTNTGTGLISTGSVTDSTVLTGNTYTITFTSATTYDIIDTTSATAISSGNTYTSSGAITFDGMQVQVTGAPASGDSFTIAPSTNQSIFTTLNGLINALQTPVSNAKERADLAQNLQAFQNHIGNALDNVMTIRASVGARLNEIDVLNTEGDDRDAHYAESIANLQELDYTKAVTDLTKQKTMLEAVQQSFVQTVGLSLFKYF